MTGHKILTGQTNPGTPVKRPSRPSCSEWRIEAEEGSGRLEVVAVGRPLDLEGQPPPDLERPLEDQRQLQ